MIGRATNGIPAVLAVALLGSIFAFETSAAAANDEPLASGWVAAHGSRVRLVAGSNGADGKQAIVAGIEISLEPGWKTYWTNPGETGGVPPDFKFDKSLNIASAMVRFPAPRRMIEPYGQNIGYKAPGVTFPVELQPAKAGDGMYLSANVAYGICREVCVPVEVRVELEIPSGATPTLPPALAEALSNVPRPEASRAKGDPILKALEVQLDGDAPNIEIKAEFSGDGEGADVFLEASDGVYVPMTKRMPGNDSTAITFVADLTDADPEDLKGKTLKITLVSDRGSHVAERLID